MNLGVDSWRAWLTDRIADVVERYGVDAYFLDIAGGWVNNPKADMHEARAASSPICAAGFRH